MKATTSDGRTKRVDRGENSNEDNNLTLFPQNIGLYLCVAYQTGTEFYRYAGEHPDEVEFQSHDADYEYEDDDEVDEHIRASY